MGDLKKRNPVERLIIANTLIQSVAEDISAQPNLQPNLQPTCNQLATDCISRQAAIEALACLEDYEEEAIEALRKLPSVQPEQQNARIFQEIIVRYPSISTYPEYEGKPYFSIKYMENGECYSGYGTYKSEVLSEYLKEYFIPSAQPKPDGNALSEQQKSDKLGIKTGETCTDCIADDVDWYINEDREDLE